MRSVYMKRPLISHEIPKKLFHLHDEISDYPYVLGHLLSKDAEYASFYKNKLANSPYSILDNSAFELGESIPFEELYNLGQEYRPTHLVLPDKVNDFEVTLNNAKEYLAKYREPELKYIGVCQGDTFDQIYECMSFYLSHGVDIVALPFDLIKDSDYVTVRFRFLKWWYNYRYKTEEAIKLKIHLLGTLNPIEFALFKDETMAMYIYSVDTSSPIINGWVGNEFTDQGLLAPKPSLKLADNLDTDLTEEQINLIYKNINKFKSYVTW